MIKGEQQLLPLKNKMKTDEIGSIFKIHTMEKFTAHYLPANFTKIILVFSV